MNSTDEDMEGLTETLNKVSAIVKKIENAGLQEEIRNQVLDMTIRLKFENQTLMTTQELNHQRNMAEENLKHQKEMEKIKLEHQKKLQEKDALFQKTICDMKIQSKDEKMELEKEISELKKEVVEKQKMMNNF